METNPGCVRAALEVLTLDVVGRLRAAMTQSSASNTIGLHKGINTSIIEMWKLMRLPLRRERSVTK